MIVLPLIALDRGTDKRACEQTRARPDGGAAPASSTRSDKRAARRTDAGALADGRFTGSESE